MQVSSYPPSCIQTADTNMPHLFSDPPRVCYYNGMPIYEYDCSKCGKTFEIIQKMSDKPLKKHAACGGSLTKLISASGFQFKGTGWYVTDYAKKSGGPASETKEAASKNDSSPKSTGESSTPTAAKTNSESSKKSSDSKN